MITPDTRDWTFVLQRSCPECGYDAGTIDPADLAGRLRLTLPRWQAALARADARERPSESVWSPLEYGCHVRDVFLLYDERLTMMITHDDPTYPNWDQDATAVEQAYGEQDPAAVAAALTAAGAALADRFDGLRPAEWTRTGHRDDGRDFTVASFGRYFLHDIEHHLWDVETVKIASGGRGAAARRP